MHKPITKHKQDPLIYSDDELNQEINDKLSQLWTGMKNKRKQMIRNLTPSYSRTSQRTLSQLNSTQNHPNKVYDKNQTNNSTHNQTAYNTNNQTAYNSQNQAGYNTHSQNSYINHNQTIYEYNQTTQSQILKIKQKLASQQSARKHKQTQIQRLKNTINQLNNDKKILFQQLQNMSNNSISVCNLNQSSIDHIGTINVDGKTASFSTNKKKSYGNGHSHQIKKDKSYTIISEVANNKENRIPNRQNSYSNKGNRRSSEKQVHHKVIRQIQQDQQYPIGNFSDLSKSRLIQLLKSTNEYRQFAFYYDSHQLSYLKRLQIQHRKNCTTNHSKIEKRYWAPTQLIQIMSNINRANKLQLTQSNIEEIISQMKGYFEMNQSLKIKQIKQQYQRKIDKLKREKNNNIPYDLVRLSNAKQREISQIYKKRNKSLRQ